MASIVQGQQNLPTSSNVLDIYTHVKYTPTDPASLAFKIFDISSDTKRSQYYAGQNDLVQVFPKPPGAKEYVIVTNSVTDNPPGHKLETGHFYAPWTCARDESIGDHLIEWFFKRTLTSSERTFREEFYVAAGLSQGSVVSIDDVRCYLRDAIPRNLLLDNLDYSDHEIICSMGYVLDRFNTMPVMTVYMLENFPSKYLLLIGTAAHLLEHNSWEQLRNQLSYNDGNIHMGIHDKHQLYLAGAQTLWAEWKDLARQVKNSINLDGAWGDLGSPYRAVRGVWGY